MKKESGFTLVEVLAVVVLLGLLLSLLWNMMVQNAYRQKRVQDEMEAQNSAKALLNHIGEVVMEQNVPIVQKINDAEVLENTDYADVIRVQFNDGSSMFKSGQRVRIDGSIYEYIDNISVRVSDRSMSATITAASDKAKVTFSSTFYTRNN